MKWKRTSDRRDDWQPSIPAKPLYRATASVQGNPLLQDPRSDLVDSECFDQLPAPMKDHIHRQLHNILTNRHYGPGFDHLGPDDRQAILEIVRETKIVLPDYWRK